jgi:hypothetical protein
VAETITKILQHTAQYKLVVDTGNDKWIPLYAIRHFRSHTSETGKFLGSDGFII